MNLKYIVVIPEYLLQHLTVSRSRSELRRRERAMTNDEDAMAATDQTYRNQKTLDIVFAVSCVLMLLSMVWMFVRGLQPRVQGGPAQLPRRRRRRCNEQQMLDKLPDAGRRSSEAQKARRGRPRRPSTDGQGRRSQAEERELTAERDNAQRRRYRDDQGRLRLRVELLQHRRRASATRPASATSAPGAARDEVEAPQARSSTRLEDELDEAQDAARRDRRGVQATRSRDQLAERRERPGRRRGRPQEA